MKTIKKPYIAFAIFCFTVLFATSAVSSLRAATTLPAISPTMYYAWCTLDKPDGPVAGASSASNGGTFAAGYTQGGTQLRRDILLFELPELPGQTITSATLTLTITALSANIPSGADLKLYHSPNINAATQTFGNYNDISYTDTGLTVAVPSDRTVVMATPVTRTFDVTSLLNNTSDKTDGWAAFRLQVDGFVLSSLSTTTYQYVIGAPDHSTANYRPTLVITTEPTVPEPATTVILVGLCVLTASLAFRFRSR